MSVMSVLWKSRQHCDSRNGSIPGNGQAGSADIGSAP